MIIGVLKVGNAGGMLKKVIWAIDGSPTTKSEYPVAKDLAGSSGAKLIVAHAGEMISSSEAGIFVDSTETLQATLERMVDDLKREGLDTELALVKASMRMRPTDGGIRAGHRCRLNTAVVELDGKSRGRGG